MDEGLFSAADPATGRYARVVLERGIDQPEGLTYSVPRSLQDLEVGERVRAPLGPRNRPAPGYVIEVLNGRESLPAGLDPARIKPLIGRASRSRQAASARFPPGLVRLAVWISQYYCCPIGLVLSAMLPAAVRRQTGIVQRRLLEPVPSGPEPTGLTPSARRAWEALQTLPPDAFPIEPRALADRLGVKTLAPVNRLVRAGLLRQVVRGEVRSAGRIDWTSAAGDALPPAVLTEHQVAAVAAITRAAGSFRSFLLFGVTASGKTEVYLRCLERVLEREQSAAVLVPEISLTPQTAGRFLSRFRGAGVAVLHSGLGASERHAEWTRVANGEARVVVGARSAVFAPVPAGRLGLIVVDEEHDASYKQDQAPRYHARDVALRRGQLENCPVVLGSATPSMESWHNARTGRHVLLELPERVVGGGMPRVHVVDMFDEARARQDHRHLHALGPTLEDAMRRTLAGSGQIMLLLNRRGYASYICCSDATCGWHLTCRHCDVTAVYHKRQSGVAARESRAADGDPRSATPDPRGVVRCHHCLAETVLPKECPVCGKRVNTFGFGTQRLEEEIERKFDSLRLGVNMLRLDTDAMRHASDYFDALARFRSGEVRVLLGTQMIAKGLDFPNVELIGVINADTGLHMPDFRAEERTFQIISQVAGRAGRSEGSNAKARVIVQSWSPGSSAIRFAAAHDYRGFAERELSIRAEAGLPPIGRMVRIICRDARAERADQRAREIAGALGRIATAVRPSRKPPLSESASEAADRPSLRVRGPIACPIARIGGFYRYAVELQADSPGPIQQALASLRSAGLVRSDARTAVDVDPIVLL